MKAFKTILDDTVSIVFADTASQARHTTRVAALEACYTNVEYADINVWRAKEYDNATIHGCKVVARWPYSAGALTRSDK